MQQLRGSRACAVYVCVRVMKLLVTSLFSLFSTPLPLCKEFKCNEKENSKMLTPITYDHCPLISSGVNGP